jgi:hypothetical protein
MTSRADDPDTSKDAGASISTAELEAIVLDLLVEIGPSTTHELAAEAGIHLVSISPRMAPLRRKGLVEDSGERRVGASNRKSIVWRLT